MNILTCGDVVAKPGRVALGKYLPLLIEKHKIDISVVNVDNIAHGLGVTQSTLNEVFGFGADICTGGNHLFDKPEIIEVLKSSSRLLRPYNYTKYTPGVGLTTIHKNGHDTLVVHLAGQSFMKQNADNPFLAMESILSQYQLGKNIDAIIVDFHAEANSEKVSLGHFLDGKVSFVFGTHTHIPTADLTILPHGTAYITDLGMTGDYNSVIGVDKDISISTFLKQGDTEKFRPTSGEATFCGAIVTLDQNGLANNIQQIKIGGVLNKQK